MTYLIIIYSKELTMTKPETTTPSAPISQASPPNAPAGHPAGLFARSSQNPASATPPQNPPESNVTAGTPPRP